MYADLRRLREDRGLSIEQLAEKSGVSAEKIREIESGIFPELDEFIQFAHENNMTVGELAGIYDLERKLEKIRSTRRWRLKG